MQYVLTNTIRSRSTAHMFPGIIGKKIFRVVPTHQQFGVIGRLETKVTMRGLVIGQVVALLSAEGIFYRSYA